MSRPLGLLLLATVVGSVPSVAQDRQALAAEVARLERRVDSLRARREDAAQLVAAASSGVPVADLHGDLGSIQVGGLRIRTNRSPLPVEAGAREAWSLLEGYFGTELARIPLRELVIEGIDPDSGHGELGGAADLTLAWDRPAHEVAALLMRKVVPPPDDPALVAWLHGAPAPVPALGAALATVRTQLILSPYSSGRDCVTGAVPACLGALQLLSEGEWAEAALPRPSDRTELARALARGSPNAGLRALVGRCLSPEGEAGCAELVATLEPAALPMVADASTRRTLLAVAIRRGGPEAYGRLRASAGRPMGERLSAAAGIPVDSLIAEWLHEVEGAARATTPWSARMGFGGIAWVGLLLLASLWSSRWRAE